MKIFIQEKSFFIRQHRVKNFFELGPYTHSLESVCHISCAKPILLSIAMNSPHFRYIMTCGFYRPISRGYVNVQRASDAKSALSLSNSIEPEWCVNANTQYLHRTWSYRYNNSMFLWNWLSDYHKFRFLWAICVLLILK